LARHMLRRRCLEAVGQCAHLLQPPSGRRNGERVTRGLASLKS